MPQQRSPGRDRRPATPERRPPQSASRRKRERRRQARLQGTTAVSPWRRFWPAAAALVTAAAVAIVVVVVLTRGHTTTSGHPTPSPAATPVPSALASLATAATGSPVGGITCDPAGSTPTSSPAPSTSTSSTAHLALFVDGAARGVPAGVGIGPPRQTYPSNAGPLVSGTCNYWLYTQTQDGIIHVQPPAPASYTLGNFFDIWGQPLSSSQAGPASGTVTVLVNGSPFTGDPRSVPLTPHAVIQVDVGTVVPFHAYTFPAGT